MSLFSLLIRALLIVFLHLSSHAFGSLMKRRQAGDGSSSQLQQHMSALHQEMLTGMDDDGDDGDGDWVLSYSSDDSQSKASTFSEKNDESPEQDEEEILLPPQPDPIYEGSDAAAGFLEKQSGIKFTPEGTQPDLDVSPKQRRALINAFDERPDLFGHCMLIHDFAVPLRVGSAIIQRGRDAHDESEGPTNSSDSEELPPSVLHIKGGVFDRDAGASGDAMPEVSMFAFLESVAGEVAVIPNGAVARWSSKKRVPIAGYLCNEGGNMVLYSLPTPCVATTLGDDGMPRSPPRSFGPGPAPAPGLAPAPAAAQPSGLSDKTALLTVATDDRMLLDPEQADPATRDDFVVFVGTKKLYFGSKQKAETFCMELTDSIADDMGDHEFDTDLVAHDHYQKNPSGAEFVQMARRKPATEWTVGIKSLLVVVVDWKYGDNSRRPYSKQTKSVDHYRNNIFPHVRSAFQRMSYGKFDLEVTFVPEVVRFAKPRSRYTSKGYPFPGLYIGAQEGLEKSRFARRYNFDDYDLVYVISPQQSPVGTKGVAWVGAKGAMCNGCEEISNNFQIMVAVHELGHNLGLAHAGSKSLEYGNPFDWMGNYPDVTGLSYGAGYKLRLHWLPPQTVAKITDRDLGNLNDKFIIQPFDIDQAPKEGQLVAIQVSLGGSTRDLFITYRHSLQGADAGVFIVLQDKGKPDSELIDLACHTPSQRDARLQPKWTYMDPSSKIVVYLESIDDKAAILHVFDAPQARIGAIRARSTFTDGKYKCPRTCTDSDLLVAQFKGCSALAGKGYCRGGKISSGGKSQSVSTDLCPASCGNCDQVLKGSTTVGKGESGCSDRNIRIGGKSCRQARRANYCERDTNIGHIGRDLCPQSCGKCPPAPSSRGSSDSFSNPIPSRTRGVAGGSNEAPLPSAPTTPPTCTDDPAWEDKDGDGCRVYADFIARGRLSQQQACAFGAGAAGQKCKETCGACAPVTAAPPTPIPVAEEEPATEAPEQCEDSPCVTSWQESFGQCYKCEEFKDTYCGQDALFMQSCPKSCNLCSTGSTQACADDFKQSSCEEYSKMGFCDQPKVLRSCKKTCGFCGALAASIQGEEGATLEGGPTATDASLAKDAKVIAIVDEQWEWGSKQALKKPAEKAEKEMVRKGLSPAPETEKHAALRFGPFVIVVVLLVLIGVFCFVRLVVDASVLPSPRLLQPAADAI